MRILVTGGTGFLGSAFVRAARSAGHELAVISRNKTPSDHGVRVLGGDIETPPWGEIYQFAPDACVHAAWITTPGVYLDSPENDKWLHWSASFLSHLARKGTKHITALGTCIEYQITGEKLKESTSPLQPGSPYARAKCQLHEWLRSKKPQVPNFGLPASTKLAWARIFYPYGEGEHPAKLASSLITKLQGNEPVRLRTPHSTKDYIHADDAGSALLALVEHQFDGPINVGTGEGVTVEAIARKLGNLMGCPDLIVVPNSQPIDPFDHVVADASQLRMLGWRPQISLDAGLQRLVEARRVL